MEIQDKMATWGYQVLMGSQAGLVSRVCVVRMVSQGPLVHQELRGPKATQASLVTLAAKVQMGNQEVRDLMVSLEIRVLQEKPWMKLPLDLKVSLEIQDLLE
jgi:hypothetical protein